MRTTPLGRLIWLSCTGVQTLYACADVSRNYSEPRSDESGAGLTSGNSESGAARSTTDATASSSSSNGETTKTPVSPDDDHTGATVAPAQSDATTDAPGSIPSDGVDAGSDGADAGPHENETDPTSTGDSSSTVETSDEVPALEAVQGRLIDFWGHPVPGVEVVVGESAVMTNGDGEFVVDDVGPTYDVSFVLILEDTQASYGYQFVQLSRRDPVLQVFEALPPLKATLTTTASGVALEDDLDVVGISFGSDDGNWASWVSDTGNELSPVWSGPSETLAGVHAIHWRESNSLPTEFLGYFNDTIALTSGDSSTLDVMLGGGALSMATISGTVTGHTNADRVNSVYVTFDDGASIEVIEDSMAADSDFSYLVPSVGGATLVFAASESLGDGDRHAMVYKRGVAPGASQLGFQIPTPATLEQPADGATVSAETEFGWALPGDDKVVVLRIEDAGKWGGMYVITDRSSVRLPTFATYSLRTQQAHYWRIETHRECESIDQCAGPDGFLDPIGAARSGIGKIRRDGTYTESLRGVFVTE